MLLEKIFYYYKDYQTKYQEKLLSIKDDKIDEQSNKIDEQSNKIDELLKLTRNIYNQNENLKEDNKDLKEDINNLSDKVEEVRDTFKEQTENINPPIENKEHMFVLLQYKDRLNEFKIIRGQNKYLDKQMTNEMNVVIDKRYNPNPIDLFTTIKKKISDINFRIKEKIRDDRKERFISVQQKKDLLDDLYNNPPIIINYNTMIINPSKMTLRELIDLILECDDIRRRTPIP